MHLPRQGTPSSNPEGPIGGGTAGTHLLWLARPQGEILSPGSVGLRRRTGCRPACFPEVATRPRVARPHSEVRADPRAPYRWRRHIQHAALLELYLVGDLCYRRLCPRPLHVKGRRSLHHPRGRPDAAYSKAALPTRDWHTAPASGATKQAANKRACGQDTNETSSDNSSHT